MKQKHYIKQQRILEIIFQFTPYSPICLKQCTACCFARSIRDFYCDKISITFVKNVNNSSTIIA